MARHFILTLLSLFIVATASAQDDDMYFTPKRDKTNNDVRTPRSEVTDEYDYNSKDNTYHSGSIRDIDEYNRRGKYGSSQSWGDREYAQGDSILVSRKDYENSIRMKRFDGYNNITLIVDDPWYDTWYPSYYDPWYSGSLYWRTGWYSPWRYTHYSYYDPWYVGLGWHSGWYGNWGWHHSWYRPVHYYGRPYNPRPTYNPRPSTYNPRPSTYRPGVRVTGNNAANRVITRMRNNQVQTNRQPANSQQPTPHNLTPKQSRQYTPSQSRRVFSGGSSTGFSGRSGGGSFPGGSRSGFSGGSRTSGAGVMRR